MEICRQNTAGLSVRSYSNSARPQLQSNNFMTVVNAVFHETRHLTNKLSLYKDSGFLCRECGVTATSTRVGLSSQIQP